MIASCGWGDRCLVGCNNAVLILSFGGIWGHVVCCYRLGTRQGRWRHRWIWLTSVPCLACCPCKSVLRVRLPHYRLCAQWLFVSWMWTCTCVVLYFSWGLVECVLLKNIAKVTVDFNWTSLKVVGPLYTSMLKMSWTTYSLYCPSQFKLKYWNNTGKLDLTKTSNILRISVCVLWDPGACLVHSYQI